jgi:hypothetical protein
MSGLKLRQVRLLPLLLRGFVSEERANDLAELL